MGLGPYLSDPPPCWDNVRSLANFFCDGATYQMLSIVICCLGVGVAVVQYWGAPILHSTGMARKARQQFSLGQATQIETGSK